MSTSLSSTATATTPDTATAVRRELLRLAREEEDMAAAEAAAVPYWSRCPATVQGHRLASAILRADADRFLQTG
jgi:hypothetical protein